MTPSDKLLRNLAVAFAAVWLGSLAFSPSCRPQFWVSQAIGELFGMLLAAPVAMYLLAVNVRAKAPVQVKTPFWRVLVMCMLLAGVAGAMTSLGCARLEAVWPTDYADLFWVLESRPSRWKVLGQWLMVAGFAGLLAVSAKPPKGTTPRS